MKYIVLIAFVAITVLFTWPVTINLDTHIAGVGGDPWQTMWRFEKQASTILNQAYWMTFFGSGEPQLVNYSTLLWWPLQMTIGQPITYNIVWLLSFVLSGFFMYLLTRDIFRSSNIELKKWHLEYAAFLSGLVYMLLPYHFAHALGHFGALQMQWLPLAILIGRRFLQQPTIWNTIGFAGAIAIQAWTEHHYALWMFIFMIVYGLFHRRLTAQLIGRQRLPYAIIALFFFFFFIVLPYWPTVRLAAQDNSRLELGREQTLRFSADLLSYIIPSSFHSLWGVPANAWFQNKFAGNVAETTNYLGLVILLMIIFFRHKIPRRQYYFWVSVASIFLIISLGPQLQVIGRPMPIPLPYAVIDNWPVFSSIRAVGRAGVMVGLAVAILFGWVAATQIRRLRVAALIVGLIMLEFLALPIKMQSTEILPAYASIGYLSGSRILEIPAATNYALSSRSLWASLVHGKEIVGSIALERALGEEALQEVRSLPAVRQLLYLKTGQLRLDRPDFFNQDLAETLADAMDWLDIGGIVLHSDSLEYLQQATLENFLEKDLGLVAQEFDDITIYPVSQEVRKRGDGVFLSRDRRWENVAFDMKRGSTFAEIPKEAGVTLYNTNSTPINIKLTFRIAPESHGNIVFISSEESQQLTAAGGENMAIPLTLPPRGKSSFMLRNQLTQKIIIQDPKIEI